MEEQIANLAESKFRERVIRARQLTVVERFEAGIELFEDSLGYLRDAIRFQFPDADDVEIESLLKKRIRRVQQVRERSDA
jgi:hypothetical protein